MGQIKALLVGVCFYPVNNYKSLPLCNNDVQAVKDALISGLNVSENNIQLCGQYGITSKNDLLAGLQTIASKASDEDTFIFYFSGHGGKKLLALSDVNLSLQCLIEYIEKIPVKNKIIILDSCHSGDFAISDTPALDMSETVEEFVGRGYAVLASCGAGQTSGFENNRKLSAYTSFLVDAITSHFLIRQGKKSLESINEAIIHFAKAWNATHPSKVQTPIFRSNIGGTIFFDVEEYNPYHVKTVYEETERYVLYEVAPVHTGLAKRLSAKVILRYKCSLEEIAAIADEIKEKIKYESVYQNEIAESRHKGKAANIVWCYFGYSEEDIVDGNFIGHTTWVDDSQDKAWWYKEKKNAKLINNVFMETNTSYDMIRKLLHDTVVPKDELIEETHRITEKLVNAAQRYIALYREFCNGVLSECELFDAVDPINHEITRLYFQQSNLTYPPKELHEWANAHTQLAATIQDFSLFYNKKNLGTWTTENRKFLMNSAIKRYEDELVELSAAEKMI